MSITEGKYRWLAEQSYWVEEGRDNVDYHPNDGKRYYFNEENRSDVRYRPEAEKTSYFSPEKPSLGQFQVLKVKDNTENGMQAMAVAPVDKNGQVDYSEVVIAYAGLNIAL